LKARVDCLACRVWRRECRRALSSRGGNKLWLGDGGSSRTGIAGGLSSLDTRLFSGGGTSESCDITERLMSAGVLSASEENT
jgi:hypothetical protein